MRNSQNLLLIIFALGPLLLKAQGTTNYGSGTSISGVQGSFFGFYAGSSQSTGGANNSYFGAHSGRSNTVGLYNTFAGAYSGYSNIDGDYNVFLGCYSGYTTNSSTANNNTFVGSYSGYSNTGGSSNSAFGYNALYSNSLGVYNTAIGVESLKNSDLGGFNTGVGFAALESTTSGSYNNALGKGALDDNTTGNYNTGIGSGTLNNISTGSYNTALGHSAGGAYSSSTTNSMALGYGSVITASNQIRLGNTSITSIGGYASWSTVSDGRFKENVREDVIGLELINKLRPVSYNMNKGAIDAFLKAPEGSGEFHVNQRQVGLVAQEVEEVLKTNGYSFSGVEIPLNDHDHYRIRYAEFVVPLIKAVQELSAKLEEQKRLIDELTFHRDSIPSTKELKARMSQNIPNPFKLSTEIPVDLDEQISHAEVVIYNLEGRQIKTIELNERGNLKANILEGELAPGMYIYALIADGDIVDTKRMIVK